jgi:transcriptional regulator with XRE-family HTH domain
MNFFHGNFKTFRNTANFTQDQLAKLLSLEQITIANYESGKATPSIPILKKIVGLYGISLDYLILFVDCQYPRNLKMLKLAKSLDAEAYSEARSNIEGVVKTLFDKNTGQGKEIKQDFPELNLNQNFKDNLKELRALRKMTQPQLAEALKISRSLVSQYEFNSFPSAPKLLDMSKVLDVSMHALILGEKLFFDFEDRIFGKTILLADHKLSIDDHKMLIRYMEAAINNQK